MKRQRIPRRPGFEGLCAAIALSAPTVDYFLLAAPTGRERIACLLVFGLSLVLLAITVLSWIRFLIRKERLPARPRIRVFHELLYPLCGLVAMLKQDSWRSYQAAKGHIHLQNGDILRFRILVGLLLALVVFGVLRLFLSLFHDDPKEP